MNTQDATPERDYDAASDGYADPTQHTEPVSAPLTGTAAAQAGAAVLLAEYGSMEEITRAIRRGRPRVGNERSVSRVVKGTVPGAVGDALREIEAQTGRTEAELVREGMASLVERYATTHAVTA